MKGNHYVIFNTPEKIRSFFSVTLEYKNDWFSVPAYNIEKLIYFKFREMDTVQQARKGILIFLSFIFNTLTGNKQTKVMPQPAYARRVVQNLPKKSTFLN